VCQREREREAETDVERDRYMEAIDKGKGAIVADVKIVEAAIGRVEILAESHRRFDAAFQRISDGQSGTLCARSRTLPLGKKRRKTMSVSRSGRKSASTIGATNGCFERSIARKQPQTPTQALTLTLHEDSERRRNIRH
jgi:hypothetical protein